MREILNTLYVTSENKYLSLDGENIVVKENKKEISRVPLSNLDSIITFSYTGASPSLIRKCSEKNVPIVFMNQYGSFMGRTSGKVNGNVLVRKKQYQISDSKDSILIVRNMILAKVYNSRWILERFTRDHPMQVNCEQLKSVSTYLKEHLKDIRGCEDVDMLRGIEGKMASEYFSIFNELIIQQKENFFFHTRSRRPPLDNVNALLSLSYSLLTSMTTAALEGVGLDPCVGFMHGLRPGRYSLALDLMEELRPVFADRFVIKLINKRILTSKDFQMSEDGAVALTDEGRKVFLKEWQERKKEEIVHPYLGEKLQWGMVPHIQALLLARHIRGDLEEYPPFLWK